MKKVVRYNGKTESVLDSSNPSNLIVGNKYTVIDVVNRGVQTDYLLRGVKGHYDSSWFTDIFSLTTDLAFSETMPILGEEFTCATVKLDENNHIKTIQSTPSIVLGMVAICDNIYYITTYDGIYVVKIV